MIDIRHCCIEGLNIAMKRFDRKHEYEYGELRLMEAEHQSVCQECNPTLLATGLFGKPVEIREETRK